MSHPLVGWRTSDQDGWGLRSNLICRGIFEDFHAGSKGNLYSKIATRCPFCKHFITFGLGYDCTRISGLLIERICSGHNGLFARLLLIALSCSRHRVPLRFCKRRFDLFSISNYCFTIVGGRFLSINRLGFEGLPSNSSRFALRQEISFLG